MTLSNRRDFLRTVATAAGASATLAAFPPALRKALGIAADRRSGTLEDVAHVVIFMQENRSFDHYFGTLRGVRGFGDRFPIPLPDAPGRTRGTVWQQASGTVDAPRIVLPFPLAVSRSFAHMRVSGTPHRFDDAQRAWDEGRMDAWPRSKLDHALGFYEPSDLPFQRAMADAFTLCDAYHCAFHGGTNPNRVMLWTGTNDAEQRGRGPVITNDYDSLTHDPEGGYAFATYCERLEAAGIRWQVYQDMDDNFTDNPLAGFRSFRDSYHKRPGALAALAERGLSTRALDKLAEDVVTGNLPEVSWIVSTAEGSEHPGPSSPAQGAAYTARVIEALTADPAVFAKTVLFLMFDENDGFFDHVPPPAPPSFVAVGDRARGERAGDATVDTAGEYHTHIIDAVPDEQTFLHKPYGLGPRVPMYVISPWSKGGWVNSEVFDHTSVIRFVERRFGVREPNISPWRRAVCGDLTSTLDFAAPDDRGFIASFPRTDALAERARALAATTTPPLPPSLVLPEQEHGTRPSRALPYALEVTAQPAPARLALSLTFANTGAAGAVLHVYDRLHLARVPRRYTVGAKEQLTGTWDARDDDGAYDLWVLGPGGFHRHFVGDLRALMPQPGCQPEIRVGADPLRGSVYVRLDNAGAAPCTFVVRSNAYVAIEERVEVAARAHAFRSWSLADSGHWYDLSVRVAELPGFTRRFAGRVETGRHGTSDPAMGGPAIVAQD
ncbi:MAG: phospholipase C, phosphocholine-specific [Polyangiales bacterium]